jgi:hypothetical protein
MEIIERKETKKEKRGLKLGGSMGKARAGIKTLFTKHKKMLILSTMFVLLCVTGYLNFALNNTPIKTGSNVTTETSLFGTFRMTRANERTRDVMIYENLIATSTNAATVSSAEAKLLEIRENVAFETSAEGLIMTNGAVYDYEDVIVNRSNGFVNVLIKRAENIDRTQAIQIMSLLQSLQQDLDIDNVYISIME